MNSNLDKFTMPNLFVVGAPKCGTTFLYESFKSNKQIYVTKTKELNYFSSDWLDKNNSYYNDFRVRDFSKYLGLYNFKKNLDYKYLTDFSVSYLISENTPKKIYTLNPSSKIIIIFRDPIKRSISHYKMDKRLGLVSKNILSYLDDKSSFHHKQYFENSLYYKHFLRFNKFFNDDQLILINLDKGNEYIQDVLNKFLNLDVDLFLQNNKINKAIEYNHSFFQKIVQNRALIEPLKLLFDDKIKLFIKNLISTPEPSDNFYNDEKLNKTLKAFFYDDFQKTLKLENSISKSLLKLK